MTNIFKNITMFAFSLLFLASCSNDQTQAQNADKNATAINKTTLHRASIPGGAQSYDLTIRNSSTSKSLIITAIAAVSKKPTSAPVRVLDSKGQGRGFNGYTVVAPGQTLKFTDYVSATTYDNATSAVVGTNNTIDKWNYSSGGTRVSILNNNVALSTYGFDYGVFSSVVLYAKWDWMIVAAQESNGNYLPFNNNNAPVANPATRDHIGLVPVLPSSQQCTLLPNLCSQVQYGTGNNKLVVTKTYSQSGGIFITATDN